MGLLRRRLRRLLLGDAIRFSEKEHTERLGDGDREAWEEIEMKDEEVEKALEAEDVEDTLFGGLGGLGARLGGVGGVRGGGEGKGRTMF